MEDNVRAQLALTITLFHWGLHAWVTYALVGLLLALLTYRQGLPMTIKSAFYPLIGERIYGWMGDLVDVLSVITTLFGICTSLGLGVLQLNTGLRLFSPVIKEDTTSQIIIIWVITVISTVSCVSPQCSLRLATQSHMFESLHFHMHVWALLLVTTFQFIMFVHMCSPTSMILVGPFSCCSYFQ
jgi:choline-glycine betaine transporter